MQFELAANTPKALANSDTPKALANSDTPKALANFSPVVGAKRQPWEPPQQQALEP